MHAETNPLYHALLTRFHDLTGCPVLVNTSFNVRGEPIVCTPKDAYLCFMRTEMDTLVLGSFVLEKEPSARAQARRGLANALPTRLTSGAVTTPILGSPRRDAQPTICPLRTFAMITALLGLFLLSGWFGYRAYLESPEVVSAEPSPSRHPATATRAVLFVVDAFTPGKAFDPAVMPAFNRLASAGASGIVQTGTVTTTAPCVYSSDDRSPGESWSRRSSTSTRARRASIRC